MDFSTLLLIFLCMWIYSLQSRVNRLENTISEIKNRMLLDSSHYQVEQTKSKDVQTQEIEDTDTAILQGTHDEQSNISNVEAFSNKYKTETVSESQGTYKSHHEQTNESSWIMSMLTNYFTGGNLLVRIGGVILFFGLSFLVKYVAEHSNVGIGTRLSSIALVGVGLIAGGWKLREREGAYGQILQGLGVAVLYLVLYGAAKFYDLLSLNTAFLMMFVVVILGSLLASTQKSLPLMLFAVTGGFLAPILTSSGDGSHIVLFSYYLLLNLGIFFMAWRHAWRVLSLTGFAFTFLISTAWGILRYSPELFISTEPFLILFFAMYLIITILFAKNNIHSTLDSILLFGLPAVTFSLQSHLVNNIEYGAGYSALVMGALYLLLAKTLKDKVKNKLLVQSFMGIGILFITIAIPYFFDADITGAVWSLEAAAAIWLSTKQDRYIGRFFGELLLVISTLVYMIDTCCKDITFSSYAGFTIITVALFFGGYQLHIYRKRLTYDAMMPHIFLISSFAIWMTSAYHVSTAYIPYNIFHELTVSFTLGSLFLYIADKRLNWNTIGQILQFTLPIGAIIFISSLNIVHYLDPFIGIGALAFLLFMVWSTFILLTYGKHWELAKYLHIGSLWFSIGILSLGLRAVAISYGLSHAMIYLSTALIPLLSSYLFLQAPLYRSGLKQYESTYKKEGVGGLVIFLTLWMIVAMSLSGDGMPLPYVPIINMLDIAQISSLYIIYKWITKYDTQPAIINSIYALALILISAIFARAVHHYIGVPYTIQSLWSSLYFQTGLSVLWSIVAFILMFASKRYSSRPFWFAAFGLLSIVILKLFFVELANSGSIERIISFIAVGSLLLAVGYFVPLPPNEDEKKNMDNKLEKKEKMGKITDNIHKCSQFHQSS